MAPHLSLLFLLALFMDQFRPLDALKIGDFCFREQNSGGTSFKITNIRSTTIPFLTIGFDTQTNPCEYENVAPGQQVSCEAYTAGPIPVMVVDAHGSCWEFFHIDDEGCDYLGTEGLRSPSEELPGCGVINTGSFLCLRELDIPCKLTVRYKGSASVDSYVFRSWDATEFQTYTYWPDQKIVLELDRDGATFLTTDYCRAVFSCEELDQESSDNGACGFEWEGSEPSCDATFQIEANDEVSGGSDKAWYGIVAVLLVLSGIVIGLIIVYCIWRKTAKAKGKPECVPNEEEVKDDVEEIELETEIEVAEERKVSS